MMSTYVSEQLFTGVKLVPGNFLVENLKTVLAINFMHFYANSLVVAATHTVAAVFISALTGFAFAKYNFRFKKIMFYFVLGSLMIPPQLGLVGFVVEMKNLGIVNSLLPLILPGIASSFGVFWMTQYISGAVPSEILESATIDGCSAMRLFMQIVLPIIRPALVTLFLLFFLWSWNNYLTPLVIISRETLYTIPLAISMIGSEYRTDFAARILALAISIIPVLILFAAGSKQLIRGLTAGSLKG
ncbi:MAG TPA: carbohydrate ABC transporter permease [Spirochaetia bacterium]|nr:carbohydrate ABC transporter permease [Spirochaetia bacterium]